MTMIIVNIHDAKAKLSEYLDAVARGERVVICKRNQPVAELHAVSQKRTEPRPIGAGPYHFAVPDSFFAPMPDEFLDTFESGSVYPVAERPSRVAEQGGSPAARRRGRPRR